MARFTTRVELHDGTYEDYERLHECMAAEGYARIIKGDDGRWYQLPPAEYYGEGNVTIEQARDSARRAASRTGRSHAVFVTEGDRRSWWNLTVVNP